MKDKLVVCLIYIPNESVHYNFVFIKALSPENANRNAIYFMKSIVKKTQYIPIVKLNSGNK